MAKGTLAAMVALLVWGVGAATAQTRVTMADGRTYSLIVPPGRKNPPLIIAFHGGGGDADWMARVTRLTGTAVDAGFAVAYPDGSGRTRLKTWNAGACCAYAARRNIDDVGFTERVIADAVTQARIDRDAVFVVGMSNGGMMAARIAAAHPDLIRAAASVAGPLDLDRFPPRGPVPYLHMHGTADTVVPYQGGRGEESRLKLDFSAAEDVVGKFRAVLPGPLHPSTSVIDRVEDGTRIMKTTESAVDGRPMIVFYRIEGGGHSWPGGARYGQKDKSLEIDATAEIVAFFKAHLPR